MKTVILLVALSVWISEKSSVNGALTISYSGSNTVDSTTYVLKCEIPAFNGQAAWSKDRLSMSICFNSVVGCLTTSTPPYSFRYDNSGIYVEFSTLAITENGIMWTCEHAGDIAVDFNVTVVAGPTETTKMLSTSLSIDQSTSSQNPSTDHSLTQKTETTIMTTTDIDLTISASWHVTSEVTTQAKTDSDNSIKLTVGLKIAIGISGTLFFLLILITISCCCQRCRRKHSMGNSSEESQQNPQKVNENRNLEGPQSSRIIPNSYGYDVKENNNGACKLENYSSNQYSREYVTSEYDVFPQYMKNQSSNKNDIYGSNAQSLRELHDYNPNMGRNNWENPIHTHHRLDNSGSYFARDKNNYDSRGFFIYNGKNREQEKQFVRHQY